MIESKLRSYFRNIYSTLINVICLLTPFFGIIAQPHYSNSWISTQPFLLSPLASSGILLPISPN